MTAGLGSAPGPELEPDPCVAQHGQIGLDQVGENAPRTRAEASTVRSDTSPSLQIGLGTTGLALLQSHHEAYTSVHFAGFQEQVPPFCKCCTFCWVPGTSNLFLLGNRNK